MVHKYRNIDARTLNLKTGTKKFLVKKADANPDWDELAELESRLDSLTPEELDRYNNLSVQYTDAMDRIDEEQSLESVLPGEGANALDDEDTFDTEVADAEQRDTEKQQYENLKDKMKSGETLSDEEKKELTRLDTIFGGSDDLGSGEVFKDLLQEEKPFDETIPSEEEVTREIAEPVAYIVGEGPDLDDEGEVILDQELATPDEAYGKHYGIPRYTTDFVKEELLNYRDWISGMQKQFPNTNLSSGDLDIRKRVRSPQYFSSGERASFTGDMKENSQNISRALGAVPGMSPEMQNRLLSGFRNVMDNPDSYDLEGLSRSLQQKLVTEFNVSPEIARETSEEVTDNLIQKKTWQQFYDEEQQDLLDEKMNPFMQDAEILDIPITPRELKRVTTKTQELIDRLGLPADLLGVTDFIYEIQNSRKYRVGRSTGETDEGVEYRVDSPEALIETYNLVAQSPLPNNVKKNVANIVTSPEPYRIYSTEGGHNVAMSKLDQVMSMMSNMALTQFGLSTLKDGGPGQMSQRDEIQRQEHKMLLNTMAELTEDMQKGYNLSHGQSLDYLRNTSDGLKRFWTKMKDTRKDFRDNYEKEHGVKKTKAPGDHFYQWMGDHLTHPEKRDFLKQFHYGPTEMIMALNGEIPGAEGIDSSTMQKLKRMVRQDPGLWDKMFPGTMTIPQAVKDPETGETTIQDTDVPRGTFFGENESDSRSAIRQRILDEWGKDDSSRQPYIAPKGWASRNDSLSMKRFALTLKNETLSLSKISDNLTDLPNTGGESKLVDSISNILEGLGEGDVASGIMEQTPGAIRTREDAKSKPLLNALYNAITEGLKGDYTIPQEAQREAKHWMMSPELSIPAKLEKLENLYKYRIIVPTQEDWDKHRYSPDGGDAPKATYIPPKDLPQSLIAEIGNTGEPLPERPAPEKPEDPKFLPSAPSREVRDPSTEESSRVPGKKKFDLDKINKVDKKVDSKEYAPGTLETAVEDAAAKDEIARKKLPPIPDKNRPGQEDIIEGRGQIDDIDQMLAQVEPDNDKIASLSLCKSNLKISVNTLKIKRKKSNVEEKEDDQLYGPSANYDETRGLWDAAGEDVQEDFLRKQDPDFETLGRPLKDLKKTPLNLRDVKEKYQGEQGYFNWPIIDELLKRNFLSPVPQSPRDEVAEPSDDLEEALPQESQEASEAPEHVALTPEGQKYLNALMQSPSNEAPDIMETLRMVGQYNKEGVPIRSQEDLIKNLSEIPSAPGTDALKYLAGENPEGIQYLSFFKDNKGQFDPDTRREELLIKDKSNMVRNVLNPGPIDDKSWARLSEDEKSFMNTLRDPNKDNPIEKVPVQKVYQGLVDTFSSFNPDEHSYDTPEEYSKAYTASMHAASIMQAMQKADIAVDSPMTLEELVGGNILDPMDENFVTRMMHSISYQSQPFNDAFFEMMINIAYPGTDTTGEETTEPELWASPESQMARSIINKGVIPTPDIPSGRHWNKDPRKSPSYFNVGPEGEGRPMNTGIWEEYEKDQPAKKRYTQERSSSKKADTTGPGGPDWTYEFTSGDTPTKDNKERRKHRFPFYNKPSENLSNDKSGEQGNLYNSKPGVQNMDTLEATIDGMSKTADNDLFEIHSYANGDAWLTLTLFKKAYSKFKRGDAVIQYGKTSNEINTFRRRLGTVNFESNSIKEVLRTVFAITNPGTSTPNDSFHDIQTGPSSGDGPYKKRVDYDRGPANRDGFNRPKPRRKEDTERNIFPYEDQGLSNQTKIFGEVGNFSAPIVETPEERAGTIEQDLPKPLNLDPKRPGRQNRKRTNPNESQLTGQPGGLFQEHNNPKSMQNL